MKFKKIDQSQKGEGAHKFLKIKSGESVKGVCRGEVYEFYIKWEGNNSLVVTSSTPGAKPRFRINFVVKEDGKFTSKIFEFGPMVSNQLHDMSEDYDLSETVIKISKSGQGLETQYSVIPLKDPAPLAEIRKVPLEILDHKDKPIETASENDFGPAPHDIDEESDENLPF